MLAEIRIGVPRGIRTLVTAVKGRCPRPTRRWGRVGKDCPYCNIGVRVRTPMAARTRACESSPVLLLGRVFRIRGAQEQLASVRQRDVPAVGSGRAVLGA